MSEQSGGARDYGAWLLQDAPGAWMALAADLTGCYATGASQDEALSRLEVAIPAYYAWLSMHDDYTPTLHDRVGVRLLETSAREPGAVTAFFAADAEPVNNEDLDWLLAVLGWAYDDLLAQAEERPELDGALGQVAAIQIALVAQATGEPAPEQSGDGVARLRAARAAALSRFRRASAAQREAVRVGEAGRRWSLRRGLRESVLLARRARDDLARH